MVLGERPSASRSRASVEWSLIALLKSHFTFSACAVCAVWPRSGQPCEARRRSERCARRPRQSEQPRQPRTSLLSGEWLPQASLGCGAKRRACARRRECLVTDQGLALSSARAACAHSEEQRAPQQRYGTHRRPRESAGGGAGGGGPEASAYLHSRALLCEHNSSHRHRLHKASRCCETGLRRERGASDVDQLQAITHTPALPPVPVPPSPPHLLTWPS